MDAEDNLNIANDTIPIKQNWQHVFPKASNRTAKRIIIIENMEKFEILPCKGEKQRGLQKNLKGI